MAIPVKLEVFEGPLDLLLHLIDKNKVNIYDIPIVLITEQYMEYVNRMEKKDLKSMTLEELTELGHHEEKDKQKEDGSHE